MASVNWQKIKDVRVLKNRLRHCAAEPRLLTNHTNEQIDKKLTRGNLDPLDYETVCSNFDERIAFLDAQPNANKRKDRVVALGLEIPIPNEIPDSRLIDYVEGVHKQLAGMFKDDNIIGEFTHVDEVHDYYDTERKAWRTSMRHIHAYVIPEVDNKLCCDKLFRKSNLIALNNAIEDFTQKEFGCRFMTGEKKKSKKTVEELKNDSRVAEAALSLEQEKLIYEQKLNKLRMVANKLENERKSFENQRAAHAKIVKEDKEERASRESLIQAREKAVSEKEKELDNREISLDNRENALNERERALNKREDELPVVSRKDVLGMKSEQSERSEKLFGFETQSSIHKGSQFDI